MCLTKEDMDRSNAVCPQAEKQMAVQRVANVGQNLMLTVHAKGTEAN